MQKLLGRLIADKLFQPRKPGSTRALVQAIGVIEHCQMILVLTIGQWGIFAIQPFVSFSKDEPSLS